MDLLIKNMEMPKRCGECKLAVNAYGSLKEGKCAVLGYGVTYLRERHDDCPLVEVPPHGDLVDRKKLLEHRFEVYDSNEEVCEDYVQTYHILEAPVILEANNGTDN